jgi:hypothetical protein
MKFVATINVPGYLPESDPVEFDTAREAWQYLLDELERGELRWQPDDLADPDGPASATKTALELERQVEAAHARPGTVYGPSWLPTEPDEDTSTDLGLAYSVDVAEDL